ncbi:MAG: molybdopterin oxidoreductase family protein, partial [Eggerthellaceae bacterium]
MTNSIEDITRQADLVMLVGSNPEEAHPVIGMQLRAAVERGCRLIVVDPRDIGLAAHADIHLKLRPGTNVTFAHGVVNYLIQHGLYDEDFVRERTEGFEILAATVRDYTPELVEDIGHRSARSRAAAKMYAAADAAAIMYCLGVTEHSTGTDGHGAVEHRDDLRQPAAGAGVNPLRGQNNVQGACDMGAGPDDLPGYQKVANPEVVQRFERAWGAELPRWKGTKATECFPAMVEGRIKGLFLFGEDPVRTDPDTHHVIEALESLEFMVVDDLFMTETAKYADVVLPGCSFAEKEGTFTNTERRVQRVRKAVDPVGDARPDADIFIDVMNRMGCPQPHLTAAEIMDEIAKVTPSYGGISHARLDGDDVAGRGLQWPCPNAEHPGTPILHMGAFSLGLGAFSTPDYQPSAELPDEEYPLVMMTGRILYQYNA